MLRYLTNIVNSARKTSLKTKEGISSIDSKLRSLESYINNANKKVKYSLASGMVCSALYLISIAPGFPESMVFKKEYHETSVFFPYSLEITPSDYSKDSESEVIISKGSIYDSDIGPYKFVVSKLESSNEERTTNNSDSSYKLVITFSPIDNSSNYSEFLDKILNYIPSDPENTKSPEFMQVVFDSIDPSELSEDKFDYRTLTSKRFDRKLFTFSMSSIVGALGSFSGFLYFTKGKTSKP